MGSFLSTAASLMLIYGGTAGVELIMARYATPEARAERLGVPASKRKDSSCNPAWDDAARP
jgi:hypothetical protein